MLNNGFKVKTLLNNAFKSLFRDGFMWLQHEKQDFNLLILHYFDLLWLLNVQI